MTSSSSAPLLHLRQAPTDPTPPARRVRDPLFQHSGRTRGSRWHVSPQNLREALGRNEAAAAGLSGLGSRGDAAAA
jgi:hypothetical protein